MPTPPDKSASPAAIPATRPRAIPAASVLLFRDRDVLLVKRAKGGYAGLWSAPGGNQLNAERPIDTARRELREETGLTAGALHALATHMVQLAASPGSTQVIYEISVFVGIAPHDARPCAASDAADARFMSPHALANLQLTPGLDQLIGEARALLSRIGTS